MHYPKYMLDRFIHREMPLFSHLLCKWHLKHCPRCQLRLEQLMQNEQLLDELKKLKNRVDAL
jgi:hypothetical protein